MSDHDPDDPFDDLARLSRAPLDEAWAERVRHRAQRTLAAERRGAGRPLLRSLRHGWSALALPAVLTTTCAVYLAWAVQFTAALYGAPLP